MTARPEYAHVSVQTDLYIAETKLLIAADYAPRWRERRELMVAYKRTVATRNRHYDGKITHADAALIAEAGENLARPYLVSAAR